MRYIKVLLLAVVFFLALVFFFQNQGALSQSMVLTLNLFFIPAMSSIALPFYFLVIAAFACGALMTLGFLVWDKVSLTARLMKQKWQISSLERELEKTKKKLGADTARAQFLSKNGKTEAAATAASPVAASAAAAEESLVPDPDKN
ncbi:MAG: LapA family protein [Deltaproteobacteria bacterium]|nr:LapA family protein [Deltaproteobacteria bacterium]